MHPVEQLDYRGLVQQMVAEGMRDVLRGEEKLKIVIKTRSAFVAGWVNPFPSVGALLGFFCFFEYVNLW